MADADKPIDYFTSSGIGRALLEGILKPSDLFSPEPVSTLETPTAVILTALPLEFDAVRAHLENTRHERASDRKNYLHGNFKASRTDWDVIVSLLQGPGNVPAALETQSVIREFHPSVVFFVGIAMGRKQAKIGDVVVADRVYPYGAGRAEESGNQPRMGTPMPGYDILQEAISLAGTDGWRRRIKPGPPANIPKVHIAPIASGDLVIASTKAEAYQYVEANCGDALGIEMEGHGFMAAAWREHLQEALVVRGISDRGDAKAEAEKAGSQETAAAHASAFAFEVLEAWSQRVIGD